MRLTLSLIFGLTLWPPAAAPAPQDSRQGCPVAQSTIIINNYNTY